MKSFFIQILLAIVPNFILAQVPDAFSYQAVIRDDMGGLVQDKVVSIKISILQNSIDGEVVYSERHAAITNTNGLISIQIGKGNNPTSTFSEINWSIGSYFIETAIDLSGGTNFKTIGASELLSVPYSIHSNTADNLTGKNGLPGQQLVIGENGIPTWKAATLPSIATISVTSITPTSANVNSLITSYGTAELINYGYYSEVTSGTVYDTSKSFTNPTVISRDYWDIEPDFSITLKELLPNTKYYVKSFVENIFGKEFGNTLSFTTSEPSIPFLSTKPVSLLTRNSGNSGGIVISKGGNDIIESGVVWNTSPNPTLSYNKSISEGALENFNITLTNLSPNTTYFLRSFATNSIGTGYGNEISFTTLPLTIPKLSTIEILNISNESAYSGGVITEDGGSNITSAGIVWSKLTNPTISDFKTADSSENTYFKSILMGLEANTTYFVRAYAINSVGIGYGQQRSFTTTIIPNNLAVIFLDSTNMFTTVSAMGYGQIINEGGGPVTERGFVWATNSSPTVNNGRVKSGSGIGNFNEKIIGFNANRYYHVKAYAVNNFGISYSNSLEVRTIFGLPTLTTTPIFVFSESASIRGIINDDGGRIISEKGFVWNTSPNPTISNNKKIEATGSSNFIGEIKGLNPNTTYFLRAYATNSFGTAYGNEVTITTSPESLKINDIDGNIYSTVKIGSQLWMSENLKTSRYKTGSPITYVIDNSEWSNLTSGGWSYVAHDVKNNDQYGKLYNWFSIQGDSLCPSGWHIPTDDDWTILTNYLGGSLAAGEKLLVNGETGFNALGGGYRSKEGNFYNTTRNYWWSSTEINEREAWLREIRYLPINKNSLDKNSINKNSGLSVRCLKD